METDRYIYRFDVYTIRIKPWKHHLSTIVRVSRIAITIETSYFLPKSPSIFKALVRLPPRLYHDLPWAEVLITSEPVYLGTNQSWYVTLCGRSKQWYLHQDWPDTSRYHLHLESRVCEVCNLFLKRTSNWEHDRVRVNLFRRSESKERYKNQRCNGLFMTFLHLLHLVALNEKMVVYVWRSFQCKLWAWALFMLNWWMMTQFRSFDRSH